jgi:ATP-dependent DNA ligase
MKTMDLNRVVDYQEGMVYGRVGIEPKLDGWRIRVRLSDGVPKIHSKGGEEIPLPHLQRELALALPALSWFDGELTHPDGFEAVKTAIAEQDERLMANVFDMVRDNGPDETRFYERREALEALPYFKEQPRPDTRVHLVPSLFVKFSEIERAHSANLELGYEGSVLKRWDGFYGEGDWMRIKPVTTTDCTVIGVEQSETDPSRASSIIVCEPSGVRSRVHAGLSMDALRKALRNPASVINKVMEVEHRGRYRSGRMRNTSFKRYRPDKKPAPQGVLV